LILGMLELLWKQISIRISGTSQRSANEWEGSC
jgi:hypothetical protein